MMIENAAGMKNADENILASQFPLSIIGRPFLSEISHIKRKKENATRMESNERYPGVSFLSEIWHIRRKKEKAIRNERIGRYPGVYILYLSAIDHSCRKFRKLEERKKTRQGPKVMKDILASAFYIYRSTHRYWIFRTKEGKAKTRRRSGAIGIYPGLCISI